MSWTLRTPTHNSSTTTTLTINKPTGTVQNDLLVAVVNGYNFSGSASWSGPTGWTQIPIDTSGGAQTSVYWLLAGASEPSSYSWTYGGTTVSLTGIILALSGARITSPVDTSSVSNEGSTTTSHATPSITPAQNNSLLLAIFGDGTGQTTSVGTITVGSPWTLQDSIASNNGTSAHSGTALASFAQTTAAAASATFTTVGSVVGALATIAIVPSTQNLSASGVASSEAIGSSALKSTYKLSTTGVASGQATGTAKVVPQAVKLTPSGITTGEQVGAARIAPHVTLTPTGVTSAESVGSAAVTPGTVRLSPTGIATTESTGSAVVSPGSVVLSPGAAASAETSGTARITYLTILTPSGVASGETVGGVTLLSLYTLSPTGVDSAEASGTAAVVDIQLLKPSGTASEEDIGTATLRPGSVTLVAAGFASTQSFGSAILIWSVAKPRGLFMWVYNIANRLKTDVWVMEDDE